MAADSERIAWAAGLFEGEGCITETNDTLTLRLNNTDESLVQRFRDYVDIGTVYGALSAGRHAGWVSA
jgi:hypothetical protein